MQAARLFDILREIDKCGYKKAYIRLPDMDGIGLALYNRLIRAASFRIIDCDKAVSYTHLLTGAQLSFGGSYDMAGETLTLYKSMYFTFAFILSALGVLMAALSFKFKGTKYAAPAFELVAAIALLVYVLSNEVKFVDYRPFTLTSTGVNYTIYPVITLIVLFVGAVVGVASLLTADYVEVAESKGAKKTILTRIGRYLRDLKSEIKKVVWPTKKTLIKNVTAVSYTHLFHKSLSFVS